MILVKDAISQGLIRKHWQPAWRKYFWSADGCGDNLYSTPVLALQAYNAWRILHIVVTEKQLITEQA